jgi:23S rRNA (uridine2552-2'-O)-methyltransferase
MAKKDKAWLHRHETDPYVQKARAEGYRSRSVYKLLEMHERFNLFARGQTVVDLGAAPGGWSQVASRLVGESGRVIATDILEMDPIAGVDFVCGDFAEEAVVQRIEHLIAGAVVAVVISDMAPNLSGVKAIDQPRSMYLVDLAIDLASNILKPGGSLVVKCFEGEGIQTVRDQVKGAFGKVRNFKPAASRGKSREIYLLAEGFKG